MSPRKHGPARLSTYFAVHNNHMDQLRREGFVVSDDLTVEAAEGQLLLFGKIFCQGGIYVDIWKRLRLLPEYEADTVQTDAYGYNVAVRQLGNIFRYDSPHLDHNREHHVHRYDVLAGDTVGTVSFIYSEDQIPTLREVVDEAAQWYYENRTALIEAGLVIAE